jgi:4-amino-4-deoxy-L-arabinose transferase-like glycosyltransferase
MTHGLPASRAALVHALVVFAVAAVLLALGMDRDLGLYDEGVILTGAMRVAAGDIPHADFYANYGPGQFYFIAALFKLFGQYAIVERVYDLLARAAIVALCYALVAGVARKRFALAAAATTLLWLLGIGFYGYPVFPVALLSLAAAAWIQPVLAGRFSAWRLVASGAAVGLAALIRYDIGFVLFVALGAVLALSSALRHGSARRSLGETWILLSRYVLGTSVVFLPVAAAYVAVAPLGAFIHDIFYFSIPNYARMRSMPFPGIAETLASIDKLGVYLPILICIAAACSLFVSRAGIAQRASAGSGAAPAEARTDWLLITFTVLTAAFYLKGLVRVSVVHQLASIIASLVLLGALLQRAWPQGTWARAAAAGLTALSVVSALYAAATTTRIAERTTVMARIVSTLASRQGSELVWCRTPPELRNIHCLLLDPDHEQAAQFIAANTRPGERIFVGLTRHDKIYINDNMLYFATARLPATRWHHFDSGLQTRAEIQGEMIKELQSNNVRYIVLESTWDNIAEPNGSAISSGVHLLDQYIRQNYRPIQVYGDVSVWQRNGS